MAATVPDKTPISLVLGSGGARGLAQIGVIRCLQDHGYEIRYVAGSSMGALVGGIFAAGKLEVYAHWVSNLQKIDIVRLLDWSFDGGALFKGDKIIHVLRELVGEHTIEALPIGFTAVCADISTLGPGREVWINRGPMFDAIRASIAIPTIFEPVRTDGQILVDGGVINPVPVGPTLNDRTSITVAVDLNGRSRGRKRLPPPDAPTNALQLAWQEYVGQYLERFKPRSDDPGINRVGFSDVALRSMELMQATLTQFKFASAPPTIIVNIPHDLCTFVEFDRARELIEYGYERTGRALEAYRRTTEPIDSDPF